MIRRRYHLDSDTRLLRSFDRGQDAAFEELIRRHGAPIKAYALRLMRRPEIAEEVYMETFKRIAETRGNRPQRDGSVKSYLFTIARNRCIDLMRKEKRAREALPEVAELEVTRKVQVSPLAAAELGRIADELEEALARLPEAHRDVLLLRTVHGLSSREVAAMMELDEGQVRSQLSYARKLLRKEMAPFAEHATQRDRRRS